MLQRLDKTLQALSFPDSKLEEWYGNSHLSKYPFQAFVCYFMDGQNSSFFPAQPCLQPTDCQLRLCVPDQASELL